MGIEGLTDIFKALYAELLQKDKSLADKFLRVVPLTELSGSKVIIDYSMLSYRHGCTADKTSLKTMNQGCAIGFCRTLLEFKQRNITPIVVFDQVDKSCTHDIITVLTRCLARVQVDEKLSDSINPSKVDAAIILEAKTETRLARRTKSKEQETVTGEVQFKVTDELVDLIDTVCKLQSVETHFPLVEADWRMAYLAKSLSSDAPVYILTDDTDLLLYDIGKAKVIRAYSMSRKERLYGCHYEVVDPAIAWKALGMEEMDRRAHLGAILGCDYFPGVPKIGPKSVIHLFSIDPTYLRQKRMMTDILPLIRAQSLTNMKSDKYLYDSSETHKKSFTETFTKKMLSPTCFNGMLRSAIESSVAPFKVPLEAVVDYLSCYYSQSIAERVRDFQNAVTVLAVGPLLEQKYLTGVREKLDHPDPDSDSDADSDAGNDDRGPCSVTKNELDFDIVSDAASSDEEYDTDFTQEYEDYTLDYSVDVPLDTTEPSLMVGGKRDLLRLLNDIVDDPVKVIPYLKQLGIDVELDEAELLPSEKGKGHVDPSLDVK
jgi:5'-3' exonuclease